MFESFSQTMDRIKHYADIGDIKKSSEQAEEVIQSNPESPEGYLLLAYHYLKLKQKEDVLHWISEALQREPEQEVVLEIAAIFYQEIELDEAKRKEHIQNGLRLFPENYFFHIQYAQLNKSVDTKQALNSYQEAIRLNPFNDDYLGEYAVYLYQLRKWKEAEQYEQLALQANPENTTNVLNFAWLAYQRKKYKRAQLLIEQAMRLEPNNQIVRENYKKIHPTKNVFIRAKLEINEFLFKLFGYPSNFIWRLFAKKVPLVLLAVVVIGTILTGLYALLGKNLFILLGCYFLLLFTSSKITKSMLKTAGLTDAEEVLMKKETKSVQQTALMEMKKELFKTKRHTTVNQDKMLSEELELQLSKIWNSDDISVIKEKTESKAKTSNETAPITNEKHSIEWPKEYSSRWPVYIMLFGMILSFMVRHVPNMMDEANQPKPLPKEQKQAIEVFQEDQELEKDKSIVQDNLPAVTQFIQIIKDGKLADSNIMSGVVSDNYQLVIQENINHPLLKQLADAKIEKVSTILTSSYFLLVNEQKNSRAVIEVKFGRLTHLYGENWSQSVEEKEDYQKWLALIERNGKDMEAMTGK